MRKDKYDIIVVGAGHAGCEAAYAAGKMGSRVLLITMDLARMGQMSCNPAMGGIAKGQIVREIDALGGGSGIISDLSAIQFRMLNRSKGPAMWSPRTQNDRVLFSIYWRELLESNPNIDFIQDSVSGLIIHDNTVGGVHTALGNSYESTAVIITSGTFLNGKIHVGLNQFSGGRMGEVASKGISEQLDNYGFVRGRMKTGTPPRVDGRSLDYSKMEIQEGDTNPMKFSYSNQTKSLSKQRHCWITYTNSLVHEILQEGFDESPMYTGRIEGLGPRYCPSIEDKINRFADKERHQLFVEPEGWNTVEIYVNGFSTSLPEKVQVKALKQVKGFENVKFFRPGYAIEYDFFDPTQLHKTLETKAIKSLYFAGQINGTTGYEEAACQGLMAGINAHLSINQQEAFVLNRNEAYIGVLIDDLTSKGTIEPYRMFTSRAEFRILLREDNADIRLTEKSYKLGLAEASRMSRVEEKLKNINNTIEYLTVTSISPEETHNILTELGSNPIKQKVKMLQLIQRPDVKIENFRSFIPENYFDDMEAIVAAETEVKYASYLEKEKVLAERLIKFEGIHIKDNFNYNEIHNISMEAKEKLNKYKPKTLGEAMRISGISPSDVSILLVHLSA